MHARMHTCIYYMHTYPISSPIRHTFSELILIRNLIYDFFILVYFSDFGLRTNMCLNNNMIYSHQDF